MKISECMTRDVELARPDMSLRDAAKLMAECDCGAVPVEDGDRLVGMVTDRDMAIRGLACGIGAEGKVGEVMSKEIRYCFDDDDADEVLQQMGDQQIRRMPVLNRDKRLVGIVSLGDLSKSDKPHRTGEALSGISREGGQHSQTAH